MRFAQGPPRGPSSERVRVPVFAVGRRVRVACSSENAAGVTLMDETGTTAIGKLSGGSEVEILAWRPRGAEGTRYRVRATRNALEGWLGVASLSSPAKPSALVRRIAAAAPPVPALASGKSGDSGRRVGPRSK